LSSSIVVAQDAIDNLVRRIQEAEKVEQLYSVRFGLDAYAKKPGLSLAEQKKLVSAYDRLAESFRLYNHYRNAAEVYRNYLSLNEVYLENYNKFLQDSLKAAHMQLEEADVKKISVLDAEIAQLKKTRDAVTGLKQKYYYFGTIGTVALIIIFLFIFITRNRAIRLTTNKLNDNRNKMQQLQKEFIQSQLMTGTYNYSKTSAADNLAVLDMIISQMENEPGSYTSQEKEALLKTREQMRKIAAAA
jgi:hypothetical protein